MKPRLYTIHGAAVELQTTERALAARLRHVHPDGRIGRHDAYFLATILSAGRSTTARNNGGSRRSPLLEILVERASFEAPARQSPPLSIEEVAELLDVSSKDILIWLCAGAPFCKAGDFTTGADFKVQLSALVEWRTLVMAVADISGDVHAKEVLHL